MFYVAVTKFFRYYFREHIWKYDPFEKFMPNFSLSFQNQAREEPFDYRRIGENHKSLSFLHFDC